MTAWLACFSTAKYACKTFNGVSMTFAFAWVLTFSYLMSHHGSWSRHVSFVSHRVAPCLIVSPHVSWCLVVFHHASLSLMVSDQCLIVSHRESSCLILFLHMSCLIVIFTFIFLSSSSSSLSSSSTKTNTKFIIMIITIKIIIIMQMWTIWDYSINNSHCMSRDFLPNAMFGSRPQRSKEKTAALRHAFLKRWRRQRKTSSN